MAFKRTDEKKGLSLPGLIDIIFLLLIFSLVTLSISQARIEKNVAGNKEIEFDLPEMRSSDVVEADNLLKTLMFQIELVDNSDEKSGKVVYVLRPLEDRPISIRGARQRALQDSLFAVFPENFLELNDKDFSDTPPCKLIERSIREYKENHFFNPSPANRIEIRAVKSTEFRIFNYILNLCSSYGDTIPQVIIHTLGGREVRDGIQ